MHTGGCVIAKFSFGFRFNQPHFRFCGFPRLSCSNSNSWSIQLLSNLVSYRFGSLKSSSRSFPRQSQSSYSSTGVKMGDRRIANTILLFDVDGTLTESRKLIKPDMYNFLINEVKPVVAVGLVGGSDLAKILEQVGGEQVIDKLDYIFSENGLVAYKNGALLATQSIQQHMGEQKLQKFINFSLGYMSKLELPVKRGTFIEFRNGMINICPVGRSCSQKERDEFDEYDKIHKVREQFVKVLKAEFPDLGLTFSIGGQISFDVFPTGWDKTFCLKYLSDYQTIHFFGDKVHPGENDHEIYEHARTVGHYVKNSEDTMQQVRQVLQNLK